MNRQTTYFLQRVVTGVATSVIYALFDNYRYNQGRNQSPKLSNKRQYYARPDKGRGEAPKHYNTNYNRQNRYK